MGTKIQQKDMADLTEYLSGKQPGTFEPRPIYVAEGDSLFFYFKDDESYAERVDELLTVFRSSLTDEMVGCQIKSVRFILKNLGHFGVRIQDGPIGLRLIFLAYAFTSKRLPPTKTIEEFRRAADQESELPSGRIPAAHFRKGKLVPA